MFVKNVFLNIFIILLQANGGGRLYPVYYVSKKTTETQAKYQSSKLVLLAIRYMVYGKIAELLVGLKFTIVTDCQASVSLNKIKANNAQVSHLTRL